ncbi:MAG: hypothetical protein K0B10_05640 [Vicingaceae bacterium]|nr:hypothetical protein [Vicingaceae bacterium]
MNSVLKLSTFQNKLSIRIDSKLRLLDLFLGFFFFGLAEYLLIYQHLFIFSTATIFFATYALQEAYKRRKNAIDISAFFICPSNKKKVINQYMIMDFFEYKTMLLLIHLTFIFYYYNLALTLFVGLLFVCFSFYLTLHNFLIKRYHWAFQLLTRLWIAFPLLLFMTVTNKENREITLAFFEKIEHLIEYHSYIINSSIAIVCLLFYFFVLFLMKKILITRPFTNEDVMKKVNTFA